MVLRASSNLSAHRRVVSVLPHSKLLAFRCKYSQSCCWGRHMPSAYWSCSAISLVSLWRSILPVTFDSDSACPYPQEGRDVSRKHGWITLPSSQGYAMQHGLTTGGRPKLTQCASASTTAHITIIPSANSSPKEHGVLAAVLVTQAQHHYAKQSFPHAGTGSHTN